MRLLGVRPQLALRRWVPRVLVSLRHHSYPRLQAIIRAMREDGGDERDWDSVGGLRDISTFLSAFPRVGLDHTGDLLETVATALSAEERPPELMDLAGAVVEALSEALQQEHADSPAVRALVDTLPRCEAAESGRSLGLPPTSDSDPPCRALFECAWCSFLPVLLQGTYYTEEDPEFERYLSLQESDGGAMQQEDEDEDEVEFDGEHAVCALPLNCLTCGVSCSCSGALPTIAPLPRRRSRLARHAR